MHAFMGIVIAKGMNVPGLLQLSLLVARTIFTQQKEWFSLSHGCKNVIPISAVCITGMVGNATIERVSSYFIKQVFLLLWFLISKYKSCMVRYLRNKGEIFSY